MNKLKEGQTAILQHKKKKCKVKTAKLDVATKTKNNVFYVL